MRKKALYPLAAFLVVLVFHATYFTWRAARMSKQWAQLGNANSLQLYFEQSNYLLSLSYALAGSFTIFAIMRFSEHRACSVAGAAGGITLTGLLYVGGCFLVGCCGSPMLAVYLSLFGSTFLGFAKPLVLVLTAVSVGIGFFWIEKKTKALRSCGAEGETGR